MDKPFGLAQLATREDGSRYVQVRRGVQLHDAVWPAGRSTALPWMWGHHRGHIRLAGCSEG